MLENPVGTAEREWSEVVETAVLASYQAGKGIRVLSWDLLREAGVSNGQYVDLLHRVGTGSWDGAPGPFVKYKDDLSVVDGVVTYKGRAVVPQSLQDEVLRALHRAHQGSTSMALRAADTVWWPGMSGDIARVREGCLRCHQNNP